MKHFLLILVLLSIPFTLFATNDDLSKSKGTTQDVIVSLTPSPAWENVSPITRIEVVLTIPLDTKHIKKHDIKLRCLSHKKKDKDKKRCKKKIKGVIDYVEVEKKLMFTPKEPLVSGLYEVEIRRLKTDRAHKKRKIKEIKYRFRVTKQQHTPSMSILSPEGNATVTYSYITLEVSTTYTEELTAINQTLSNEQNRTIKIRGIDNNGTYYLYNVPLIKGSNEINISAMSEDNTSLSKLMTINSDANGSAPIGMRATEYEGIGSLQTEVEVGTLLNVREYLFDSDGDGVIDETHMSGDSNFSVNLTQEGRYKPRVTIRTEDGLLYSSGGYVLSLDVKADENQKDPIGAQAIDVAKSYVQAIINNDRESVERLLGHNQRMIGYIYGDPRAQQFLAEMYSKIINWEQTYHDSGYASVKILFESEGEMQGGGFEMNVVNMQINTGRMWFIRFFY